MTAADWAGLIVSIISIATALSLAIRFLVKHYLSELTGAIRVNYSNNQPNATIYFPPTPEQLSTLDRLGIYKYDMRRGIKEGDANIDLYQQVIKSVKDINFSDFSDSIQNTIQILKDTTGSIKSQLGQDYKLTYTAENPNNLPESQINQLIDLYNRLEGVRSDVASLEYDLEKLS